MAAQEKNLTEALKGTETLQSLTSMASQVLSAIKVSKKLGDDLYLAKKALNEICTDIFLKDLENGLVYGNHVIDTKEGKLTINFRMSPESDISDYEKSLRADFKDNYADLFVEVPNTEVTTAYPNQKIQFESHPELFVIVLKKGVTMGQMAKVFKKYPECFDLIIRDKERYAEVYPSSVDLTKKIFPVNGILEKLAGYELALRKRIITVLSKFFQKNLECAVKI
jgi:hypothetical protein